MLGTSSSRYRLRGRTMSGLLPRAASAASGRGFLHRLVLLCCMLCSINSCFAHPSVYGCAVDFILDLLCYSVFNKASDDAMSRFTNEQLIRVAVDAFLKQRLLLRERNGRTIEISLGCLMRAIYFVIPTKRHSIMLHTAVAPAT